MRRVEIGMVRRGTPASIRDSLHAIVRALQRDHRFGDRSHLQRLAKANLQGV